MTNFRTPRCGDALARLALALNLTVAAGLASAQPITILPSEGIAARPSRHLVLTHARIVTEPGKVIEDGSIELRDGRIVAVHSGAVGSRSAACWCWLPPN